ncbi:MAG: hypothetical protein V2I65_18155 [Paracoccaceae bacterium]|jgi:hypothetical protein|nr:hypothetical protein [Paracoccaceae bacterium]
MPDKKSLSRLTRSLAIGTSAGAIALQVGCAPVPTAGTPTVTASGGTVLTVASQAEGEACRRAIRTRSLSSVVSLMSNFPSSSCIPFVVNTLPPSTVSAIPASAIAGLDPAIRAQLPRGVARGDGRAVETSSSQTLAQSILNPEDRPGTSGY